MPALFEPSFGAFELELEEFDRSLFGSLETKPYERVDGRGDVVRLLMDWFCGLGRLPMGAMLPVRGAVVDLESCRECCPSSPVGGVDDLPSNAPKPGPACPEGEVVFSPRDGSWLASPGAP